MTAQLTREDLARNWSFQNDPEAIQCPFRAGAKLHEGPEIFFKAGEAHVRAEGLGGNWVVTRQALQEEIFLDPARFSSYLSIGFSRLAGDDWPLVPLELDPPEHGVYRKLVAPWFSLNKARELQEEIASGWADRLHGDDLERCVSTYMESSDARRPFEMEYRLKRKDGEFRWIHDRGVPRWSG